MDGDVALIAIAFCQSIAHDFLKKHSGKEKRQQHAPITTRRTIEQAMAISGCGWWLLVVVIGGGSWWWCVCVGGRRGVLKEFVRQFSVTRGQYPQVDSLAWDGSQLASPVCGVGRMLSHLLPSWYVRGLSLQMGLAVWRSLQLVMPSPRRLGCFFQTGRAASGHCKFPC